MEVSPNVRRSAELRAMERESKSTCALVRKSKSSPLGPLGYEGAQRHLSPAKVDKTAEVDKTCLPSMGWRFVVLL